MPKLLTRRPTESMTGPALGLAVFGFCTQVGLPSAAGAVLGVVSAFGPLLITQVVVALRRRS